MELINIGVAPAPQPSTTVREWFERMAQREMELVRQAVASTQPSTRRRQ